MSEIAGLTSRMILDSRGNPTVEAECYLESGAAGRAAVPSGASTGEHEAVELRDGGKAWAGKGVEKALAAIHGEISDALAGEDALDQEQVDRVLLRLDGTPNKSRLGANAILAASMAAARAAAEECELPLYRYLGGPTACRLPIPLMNVVNGGAHANNNIDFQEFMLAPVGAADFGAALRMGVECYHALRKRIAAQGHSTAVGDEGGFAPDLEDNDAALALMADAVKDAGYALGKDVVFALDVAASSFFENGSYHLEGERAKLGTDALIDRYRALSERYPITSIEDGLEENDWAGWKRLTATFGARLRLVGDDLFATQAARLRRGIQEKAANAILVKLNQVGTVSETLLTIRTALEAGFRIVISHRSGETEDTFIADLAVATGAGWIKTGAPARSERTAKYNRLLRIAEELEASAAYGPLAP